MDMSSGGRINQSGARTGHTHAASEVDALPLSGMQQAGDLIVGSGVAAWTRVAVGSSGTALVASPGQPGGVAWTSVAAASHFHTQSQSHGSADTDAATTSLHHTIGTGANQAAAGNHGHSDIVPVGSIFPYAGTSAPANYLLCNGDVKAKSDYPALAAVCGSLYGTETSTTFTLPDMRSRVPFGYAGASGTTQFNTVGKAGGALTVTLAAENMPSHMHTTPNHTHTTQAHSHTASLDSESSHTHTSTLAVGTGGTHGHTGGSLSNFVTAVTPTIGNNSTTGGGAARVTAIDVSSTSVSVYVGIDGTQGGHSHAVSGGIGTGSSHTHTPTIANGSVTVNDSGAMTTGTAGTGSALTVVPPYISLNYIIKAK